jgi:hypothetical protein
VLAVAHNVEISQQYVLLASLLLQTLNIFMLLEILVLANVLQILFYKLIHAYYVTLLLQDALPVQAQPLFALLA